MGTINGIPGLCVVKVSNNNANGPFGGVFAVQMPNSTTTRVKRSLKFSSLIDQNLAIVLTLVFAIEDFSNCCK
jgi:hypothetical protein